MPLGRPPPSSYGPGRKRPPCPALPTRMPSRAARAPPGPREAARVAAGPRSAGRSSKKRRACRARSAAAAWGRALASATSSAVARSAHSSGGAAASNKRVHTVTWPASAARMRGVQRPGAVWPTAARPERSASTTSEWPACAAPSRALWPLIRCSTSALQRKAIVTTSSDPLCAARVKHRPRRREASPPMSLPAWREPITENAGSRKCTAPEPIPRRSRGQSGAVRAKASCGS
mmetsp:Transcript_26190/g.52999  ORF Transcript_26190/g.52999 Transcript_26190/m.52999 type:complete len:233 (+) Transcript_26190:104-802(+)